MFKNIQVRPFVGGVILGAGTFAVAASGKIDANAVRSGAIGVLAITVPIMALSGVLLVKYRGNPLLKDDLVGPLRLDRHFDLRGLRLKMLEATEVAVHLFV